MAQPPNYGWGDLDNPPEPEPNPLDLPDVTPFPYSFGDAPSAGVTDLTGAPVADDASQPPPPSGVPASFAPPPAFGQPGYQPPQQFVASPPSAPASPFAPPTTPFAPRAVAPVDSPVADPPPAPAVSPLAVSPVAAPPPAPDAPQYDLPPPPPTFAAPAIAPQFGALPTQFSPPPGSPPGYGPPPTQFVPAAAPAAAPAYMPVPGYAPPTGPPTSWTASPPPPTGPAYITNYVGGPQGPQSKNSAVLVVVLSLVALAVFAGCGVLFYMGFKQADQYKGDTPEAGQETTVTSKGITLTLDSTWRDIPTDKAGAEAWLADYKRMHPNSDVTSVSASQISQLAIFAIKVGSSGNIHASAYAAPIAAKIDPRNAIAKEQSVLQNFGGGTDAHSRVTTYNGHPSAQIWFKVPAHGTVQYTQYIQVVMVQGSRVSAILTVISPDEALAAKQMTAIASTIKFAPKVA